MRMLFEYIPNKVAEIGPGAWLWLGIGLVVFVIIVNLFMTAKQMKKDGDL